MFLDLNPARWKLLNHNPIALLTEMALPVIESRAAELVLHSRINYVYRHRREYLLADRTWGATYAGVLRARPVAYFSAEFGIHESLPIYSGGWVYSQAITLRARPISISRSLVSGCSMDRVISDIVWMARAGSTRSILRQTPAACPWNRRSGPAVNR